jgi:hypothetical protein
MLFNDLLDLIYFEKECLNIKICDILIQILGDNNEFIIPNIFKGSILDDKISSYVIDYNPDSPDNEKEQQIAIINFFLEKVLQSDVQKYYIKNNNLNNLINNNYSLVNTTNININNFIIINTKYQNNFDVCHSLNVYKYLMVIYFLDDNSIITFFNNHILTPNKGDLIIFPVAWFFVYKITKKNEETNNMYIYNNVLKIV